jgi:O-antigen ligase
MARAAFGLGTFLLALGGLGAIGALGPAIQLSDLAFAAALAIAAVSVRYRLAAVDLALLAYVVAAAVSVVGSPDPRRSLVKLLGLALLAGLFLLARHLRAATAAWLAGAAVAGLAGLAGAILFYAGYRTRFENPFIAAYGSIPVGDYPRVVGLFANPNMFCSYLVSSLAVLASAWPSAGRWRPALAGLAALLAVNAALTLSVGVGGLALGASLWWTLRGGRWRGLVLAGGVLCAAAFAALTLVTLVPRGAGDLALGPWDVELSAGGRVDVWRGALRTAAEHPIMGKGYGTLVATTTDPRATVSMEEWGTEAMADRTPVALEAHSVALSVLGQTGALGLAAFVAFVALALRRAPPAILCGLVATLLYHGLFAALEDARHVWLLLGMAAAGVKERDAALPPRPDGGAPRG